MSDSDRRATADKLSPESRQKLSDYLASAGIDTKGMPLPSPNPTPSYSADEAKALVYDFLRTQFANADAAPLLQSLRQSDMIARWDGSQKRYEIWSMGRSTSIDRTSGLYRVYETSGVVEPANDEARNLIAFLEARRR